MVLKLQEILFSSYGPVPIRGSGCYIQRKWHPTAQTAALIHHDVRVELAQNKVGAEEEAT